MANKNKIFVYYFFSEPIKDNYDFRDDREFLIEFTINNCKLRLYKDQSNFIEMLKIEIINSDREPDFIAHYFKRYIQAVLRLCYLVEFKFSKVSSKMIGEFSDETDKPKLKEGKFIFTIENVVPVFNRQMFLNMLQLFSKKPSQVDLLSSNLNFIDDPIGSYSNLYKIIEFEFHRSDDKRDTKIILKASKLKEIVTKFNYEGKTGDSLIDYIVDMRHKCDHMKGSEFDTKFGFSPSNINDIKEVQKFIPTMIKICAHVIDPGFEID
ncbi:hypothetical protein HYX06_03470 [Candidatus Woesearchaeota archaeon]|nr:hypothetical protein [Candidatus Woesearchaeota archaeon]